MKSIIFIAMLFCMGAAALLVGGIALYENVDRALHGSSATMELADPSKKVNLQVGGPDIHLVDVRYSGAKGQLVVRNKLLGRAVAQRLIDGEKIPVIYFENNPQKVLLSQNELPSPWFWLFLGAALLGTFFYALMLLRRESLHSAA